MEVSRSEANAGLLGAVAVGGFFALQLDAFRWGCTIAGATILLVLLAHVSLRSAFQSLAYSAVCGLALMLALRPILANIGTASELPIWFAVVWVLGTVLFCFIDRSRVAAAWAAQGVVVLPAASNAPLDHGLGLLTPPVNSPEQAWQAAARSAPPAAVYVAPEPVAPAPPPPPVATAPAPPPPPPPPPPVAPSRKPLWASGAANPAPPVAQTAPAASQTMSSPVFTSPQPSAWQTAPAPVAPPPAPAPSPAPAAYAAAPQPL